MVVPPLHLESVNAATGDIVLNIPRIQQNGAVADLVIIQTAFAPCPFEGAEVDSVEVGYLLRGVESAPGRELRLPCYGIG